MGIIIDLIAIAFLVVSALVAYYRGFVKTFFGFISVILAILLACCFSKPLAMHIKESSEMDEWIIESITQIGKIEDDEIESGEEIEEEIQSGEKEELPTDALIGFINDLPESVSEALDIEESKNIALLNIATKTSDVVINIFSWVIIYFIVRIIVAVITVIFDGIMNIPILKSINNLAGLVIGIFVGIFRIYLFLAIIYFISNITNVLIFVNVIQTSGIVNAMYNNNLLINLIF
ncbi:MAG: CvpA family protein [Clostridia bacterium]|nr:CvpA family protein [Clostridia bacterium]